MAAAVVVSACGDNEKPVDAPPDLPACTAPLAPYGTIDMLASVHAVRSTDGAGKQTVAFLGAIQAGPMGDTLDIQLIQGMGAFSGGPPAAGTYALEGVESQLSTCGACVVIEAGTPREYYVAQRGTLAISELDTSFMASLANVDFAHVMVDPISSVSTIVDRCRTSITAVMWDTPVN